MVFKTYMQVKQAVTEKQGVKGFPPLSSFWWVLKGGLLAFSAGRARSFIFWRGAEKGGFGGMAFGVFVCFQSPLIFRTFAALNY